MSEDPQDDDKKRDEILKRMLGTPPHRTKSPVMGSLTTTGAENEQGDLPGKRGRPAKKGD